MAGWGEITVNLDVEPTEKMRDLLRAAVQKEIALQFAALTSDGVQADIRQMVREEIENYMKRQVLIRQAQTPHLAHEIKALGEGWER